MTATDANLDASDHRAIRPSTFRRGVTLTTASTHGHGVDSNLGPTVGNDFETRWASDLALLAGRGVSDLRLTFDWPRLQPSAGRIDDRWAEHLDEILDNAAELGIQLWATLHDGATPRWFDDEGGMGDADVLTRWWPRWVEIVAERFGDRMTGWVPFAGIARDMPMQPWIDTWGILRGADSRVATSMSAEHLDRTVDFVGSCDAIGVALHVPDRRFEQVGAKPTDGEVDRVAERIATDVQRCAELADGVPIVVTQFTAHHVDPEVAGKLVNAMVRAADEAVADGIDLDVVFADPAFQAPGTPSGLLDRDRAVLPAGEVFFTV